MEDPVSGFFYFLHLCPEALRTSSASNTLKVKAITLKNSEKQPREMTISNDQVGYERPGSFVMHHSERDRLQEHISKCRTKKELSDFSLLCCQCCWQQTAEHNMWTETTRPKYERQGERYTSDVSDAEWAVISPHLPEAKILGRPRGTEFREVINALFYMARTGCQWKLLPSDLPHYSTVQYYFYSWRDNGILERINLPIQVTQGSDRKSPLTGLKPGLPG